MDFFSSIAHFFQSGGHFMYPILAVGVIGLAITVERALYIRRAKAENRKLWSELIPLVNRGDLATAVQAAFQDARASGREAIVLLSPACASFDQFADFEARGDAFRAAVQTLAATHSTGNAA